MNLLYLYKAWNDSKQAVTVGKTEEIEIQPPLMTLLYLAGWKEGWGGIASTGQQYFEMGLLKSIANKAKAKKFLYQTFKLGDPSEFRSKMLGARNLGVAATLIPNPGNSFSEKERSRYSKGRARDCLQQRHEKLPGIDECNNCLTRGEKMLHCPCRTVRYCGKACQLAHWKAGHKEICPVRKKK